MVVCVARCIVLAAVAHSIVLAGAARLFQRPGKEVDDVLVGYDMSA